MNSELSIYFCFPYIGIPESIEWARKHEIIAKSIQFGQLLVKERPFTQEEKDEYDSKYLVGFKGFCKNGKEPTKKFVNPNYEEDCKSHFRKEVDGYSGNVFLDFNMNCIDLAFEYTDDVVFILPEKDLKYDMIGRLYCQGNTAGAEFLKNKWDEYYDKIESLISDLKSKPIRVKILEFEYSLLDYVHDCVI